MAELKPKETRTIELELGMGSGYVLDFTNRTFSQFFWQELNVDIYDEVWAAGGDSKANRLRTFLKVSDNSKGARVLRALEDYRGNSTQADSPLLAIAARLDSSGGLARTDAIEPFVADQTLEGLIGAIERDVLADKPEAAIDRLHTYCMKKFKHLLETRGLTAPDTLNARAGLYFNPIKRDAKAARPISFEIMSGAVKLMESFNGVRNNQSFAHDNTVIGRAEARYVFDAVSNMLRFIKATEGQTFGE